MKRQRANEIVGEMASVRLAARGLPSLPNSTPHTLRRTYISVALLANRFDVLWVMRQVGHADSKTQARRAYRTAFRRCRRLYGPAFGEAISRRALLPACASGSPGGLCRLRTGC